MVMGKEDLKELGEKLTSIAGQGFIPNDNVSIDDFVLLAQTESPAYRFQWCLRSFLDVDGDFVVAADDVVGISTTLERLRKECAHTQKLIVNLRDALNHIGEIIRDYEGCGYAILERTLSEGLSETLKSKSEQIKADVEFYRWLVSVFKWYEAILKKESNERYLRYQDEFRKMLGRNIRQARLAKRMTLEVLSESLAISRLALNRYELGFREPSSSTIYSMAKILDVSADWLLGLEYGDV